MRGFLSDEAPRKSDLVDVIAAVVHETEKAYLLEHGSRRAWVPKAAVERDGDTFTMPEALAIEKGLI